MKLFVVTGLIGSGKSTVVQQLNKNQNISVIDTDVIAREVFPPNQQVYKKIVKKFGIQVLNDQKQINRKKLGEIVFNNSQKLQQLNKITHPAIYRKMLLEIIKISFGVEQYYGLPPDCKKYVNQKAICLVIPLYFESKQKLGVPVFNISVSDINQLKARILSRDGQSGLQRLEQQLPQQKREELADFVIQNNKIDEIDKYVDEINSRIGFLKPKNLIGVALFNIQFSVIFVLLLLIFLLYQMRKQM